MNTPPVRHRSGFATIGLVLAASALFLVEIPLGFSRDQAPVAVDLPAQPDLKAQGMIALSGQRLLLWSSGGRIQIGDPQTGWDDIIQLPMSEVVEVVGEGQGALFGGSLHPPVGEEIGVVVAIDERGSVLNKWTWKPGIVTSVATRPGERWAVARDAIWRLNPDEKMQQMTDCALGSLLVLPAAGPEILCTPADRTKERAAFPICSRWGQPTWQVKGRWDRPPVRCGAWLIEPGRTRLAVRDITTGGQLGELPIGAAAAWACSDDAGYLVARGRIGEFGLPDLRWRWQVPAALPRVRVVAKSGARLAILTDAGRVLLFDLAGVVRN